MEEIDRRRTWKKIRGKERKRGRERKSRERARKISP
jgi:hypothetical protein